MSVVKLRMLAKGLFSSGKERSAERLSEITDNIEQELTTITKQRDEVVKFVESIANAKIETVEVSGPYGGIDEWSFICDSHRERANELLSTIKGQKDEQ